MIKNAADFQHKPPEPKAFVSTEGLGDQDDPAAAAAVRTPPSPPIDEYMKVLRKWYKERVLRRPGGKRSYKLLRTAMACVVPTAKSAGSEPSDPGHHREHPDDRVPLPGGDHVDSPSKDINQEGAVTVTPEMKASAGPPAKLATPECPVPRGDEVRNTTSPPVEPNPGDVCESRVSTTPHHSPCTDIFPRSQCGARHCQAECSGKPPTGTPRRAENGPQTMPDVETHSCAVPAARVPGCEPCTGPPVKVLPDGRDYKRSLKLNDAVDEIDGWNSEQIRNINVIIEICCSEDSALGDIQNMFRATLVIRVCRDDDFAKKTTVDKVLPCIKSDRCHVLYSSLLYRWACRCRRVHLHTRVLGETPLRRLA